MFLICNTDLCMDVKTLLRTDRVTKVGKNYKGVLMRDGEDHYTFLESLRPSASKRNPHVYMGKRINVSRMNDGTLYPTFNRPRYNKNFTFQDFCREAAEELIMVTGLVEENE